MGWQGFVSTQTTLRPNPVKLEKMLPSQNPQNPEEFKSNPKVTFGVSPKVTQKWPRKKLLDRRKSLLRHFWAQKVTFGVTLGRPQKSLLVTFELFSTLRSFGGFGGALAAQCKPPSFTNDSCSWKLCQSTVRWGWSLGAKDQYLHCDRIVSAKTDLVRFKRSFEEGLLKDKFLLLSFEALKVLYLRGENSLQKDHF